MFLCRENYISIPEDIKIWYGDDWLFYRQRGRNFSLAYAGIETEMRVTSDGFAATPIALADANVAAAHGVFQGPFVDRYHLEARLHRAVMHRITRLRGR